VQREPYEQPRAETHRRLDEVVAPDASRPFPV